MTTHCTCLAALVIHCGSHTCQWLRCPNPACEWTTWDIERALRAHRDGHTEKAPA
jgi:hypothetical protein